MAYYTGDTFSGVFQSWNVTVLSDQWVALAFQWALLQLTDPNNWVTNGFYTAADAAAYFSDVFEEMFITPNPTGSIIAYAGDLSLLGTSVLSCDGAAYLKADYAALYNAIGTTFGGDSTHFNVPDLRGRLLIGSGAMVNGTTINLATNGGASTHTQTVAELATHAHTDSGHAHSYVPAVPSVTSISPGVPEPTAVPGAALSGIGFAAINANGGGNPMDIMNPYTGIQYVIVTGAP